MGVQIRNIANSCLAALLLANSACKQKEEQPEEPSPTDIDQTIATTRSIARRPKDVDLLKNDWKRGEITTEEFRALLKKTKFTYILNDIAALRAEKRAEAAASLANENPN